MPMFLRWPRALVVAAIAFPLIVPHRLQANRPDRIRPASPYLKTVIATGRDRSATLRSLVERIEQSNVIVYLTCTTFASVTMAGRTFLVSAGPDFRYVRVQLLCQQPLPGLVAIIAHELQHVVEIASAAWVVDDRSFERLFSMIGFSTCLARPSNQFETGAALETGARAHSELLRHAQTGVRTAHEERSGRRNGAD
jgi:hypothetical protein